LAYFFKWFASSVKQPGPRNQPGKLQSLPAGLSRDVVHSEAFFSQFLKKMENDIVSLSEKFWPYFFFLWLTYSLILIVIRIILQYGLQMDNFFTYFGLFYGKLDMGTKILILRKEQLGNQVIFGFLIVEFLVIHYYFSLPNNINLMPEEKINQLVRMMDAKVDFYTADDKDTRILVLKKTYTDMAKDFEGETEEDREEMTNYIRVREHVTDDKAFRGIKFPGAGPRSSVLLQMPDLDERLTMRKNTEEANLLTGNLDDLVEMRGRMDTGFRIDENLVLNNLQLEMIEKEDQYYTENKIVELVSNLMVDFDNENNGNQEKRHEEHKEEGFEDLEEKEEKKEVHILIYMDQSTTTQLKILYKERNTHVFYLGRMLNSLSYVTGRLMILPLLYSLSEKTTMNIVILFVTAVYVFRFNVGPFEDQMKVYMPIFTLVIFLETLLLYLSKIVPGFHAVFSLESESTTMMHSSFYRLWLIGIACIGYASIIWTAKFVFAHMSVVRQKVADIFYTYSLDDCKIEVDFGRWKHYEMILSTWLSNEVFAQLNDIYITCNIIYCLVNSDKTILLIIMICMFGYNIFMRLKKSYTTLVMEEQAVHKLRYVIKGVVITLFSMEFFIQIIVYFSKIKAFDFLKSWNVIGSHFMIIVSLLFYDLLRADNYIVEKRKIIKYSELKMKYSDICEAQETNEYKIYERVLLMIANDRLQTQIDRYLKQGIINSTADLNYHKTDIKEDLRASRYSYLEKYLEDMKVMKLKFTEGFYSFLLNHCNQYIQQDMLYLLSKVCQIDQGIVESGDFSLSDYLSGEYQVLDEIYTTIVSYYTNLLNKEENEFKLYKTKMNLFEKHVDVTMEEDYELFNGTLPERESIGSPDAIASAGLRASWGLKKPRKRIESTVSRNTVKSMEEVTTPDYCLLPKKHDKEKLSAAADILAKFLLTKKSENSRTTMYSSRGSAKFKIEEENCYLIFHNIKQDSMAKTQGYTRLKFFEILKILTCLFWSHLETIISMLIIFVLFMNGGIMSIFIIGIIFFRILVEERGGLLFWWEVVNITFFVQFVFKIYSSTNHNEKIENWSLFSIRAWIEILAGNSMGNAGQLDAFVQILIMWLIHFINKKIINLPEGKNLVTPGVSIARVREDYLVYYGRENNEPLHERNQQRKTEDEACLRNRQEREKQNDKNSVHISRQLFGELWKERGGD
jgi:hypothetical protein